MHSYILDSAQAGIKDNDELDKVYKKVEKKEARRRKNFVRRLYVDASSSFDEGPANRQEEKQRFFHTA